MEQKNNFGLVMGLAALAGIVGALVAVFVVKVLDLGNDEPTHSPPNALEMIDAFSCKKGLNKRVILRGIPDNFDRTQTEPTEMRAALLDIETYKQRGGSLERYYGRKYDEGGADLLLLDSAKIPRGIVSGALLIGLKAAAQNDNDSISLGDFKEIAEAQQPSARQTGYGFAISALAEVEVATNLYSIDLRAFSHISGKDILQDFINLQSRPDIVDFRVADDTIVDFAAFLLCQEPEEPKASVFREHRRTDLGPDMSVFSCSLDETQQPCDSYQGDISCDIAAPIACYKDGERKLQEGTLQKLRFNPAMFVGGEVRLSKPARGDQFANLAEVDAKCEREFGKGWRTLEFNESGTAALISYSKIAPKSFGIVNISNQSYGNCWDRPKSVINGQ